MPLKTLLAGTAVCGLLASASAASQTNVLLIIADDLGIDSLAAFNDDPGASLPPTPIIDGMQANGIKFSRFYAYPTCSPTRASILTGRYAFRTGVLSPYQNELLSNEFTLPEALTASGVISDRMAHIGKWHLGMGPSVPNNRGGWPHFSGSLGGGVPDFYSWPKTVNGTTTQNHTNYATTDNVDDSISWIGQQGTNSWFLWLAFNAPHTPLHRPPTHLHDYDGITLEGANNSRPHYEAMVQAMDTEIGRLLTNVNLAVTTVIFMGDNGTSRSVVQPPIPRNPNHGKSTVYEGGVRVPMLIQGAAVSNGLAGTSYDGVVHACDLYATILELFGVHAATVVPDALVMDSRSFAPVLRGEVYTRSPANVTSQQTGRDTPTDLMVVEGNFKYILKGDGTEELYHVGLDLSEVTNLLAGVLSSNELAAYESLTNKLASYINVPHLHSGYLDGDGKFTVEIGWFANEGFTLEQTTGLFPVTWSTVAGQEFEDNGGATLILRDPSPPAGHAVYRVSTP